MAIGQEPSGAGEIGRRHAVSAHPHPDESFIGFIFRLASLRHLRAARSVAAMVGAFPFTNRPSHDALNALADDARISLAELEAISLGPYDPTSILFRGMRFSNTVVDRRGRSHRRVCPGCLRQSPYHRSLWDFIFVSICPVHLNELVDTCLGCGRPLSWKGGDLCRCADCGQDLSRLVASPVTDHDARGTRIVFGLLGDGRFEEETVQVRGLAPFRDLRDQDIVVFLFCLGLELIGSRRKFFSMEQSGELAWRAHEALTKALDVAERWPDAFHQTMAMMWGRRQDDLWHALLRTVGAVEGWISMLPPGHGMAIRQATSDYRAKMTAQSKINDVSSTA